MNMVRHSVVANALEFISCLFTVALVSFLMWLLLIITPDQRSAECDWAREQLEKICR